MTGDPRDKAVERFTGPEVQLSGLDVILRTATDPPLAIATLLDALRPAARPGARIAEFGFGSGWLLDELRREFPGVALYGLDLSRGMARAAADAHHGEVGIIVGDMEALPFREPAFDAIATCWTLYFMRDIDAALEDIRRCLRPGGRLVAATTARDHMHEFIAIAEEAARRTLGREPQADVGERFDLISGEPYMRRHFPDVEVREWHGVMTLRDMADVMALRGMYIELSMTPDEEQAMLREFERIARERLARDGELRITRHDCAFVGIQR